MSWVDVSPCGLTPHVPGRPPGLSFGPSVTVLGVVTVGLVVTHVNTVQSKEGRENL